LTHLEEENLFRITNLQDDEAHVKAFADEAAL